MSADPKGRIPAVRRDSQGGAFQLFLAVLAALACLFFLVGSANSWPRAVACGVCGLLSLWLARRGTRARVPVFRDAAAAIEFAEGAGLPLFIYLRRFAEDARGDLTTSDEEEMAAGFGGYGLFLALGRPGEPLPVIGAYRLYVEDESWRPAVRALLRHAALVVFRWAPGGELEWEFDQVVAADRGNRVAFLLPRLAEGFHPREFLPPTVVSCLGVGPALLERGALPALVAADEEGRFWHLRGGGSQQGENKLEDLAAHLAASHLGLSPLGREQSLALRRLFGRTERVAWRLGRVAFFVPGALIGLFGVAMVTQIAAELLGLPFYPLDWVDDHGLLFAGLMGGALVILLVTSLLTRTIGRT